MTLCEKIRNKIEDAKKYAFEHKDNENLCRFFNNAIAGLTERLENATVEELSKEV